MEVLKTGLQMAGLGGVLDPKDGQKPGEVLREHDRTIENKKRDIGRVIERLGRREQDCKTQMRQYARQENQPLLQAKAREIATIRRSARTLQNVTSNLNSLQVNLMTMEGMLSGAEALMSGNEVMEWLNAQMPVGEMEMIAQQFRQQLSFLGSKAAMMQSGMEDALEDPEDEAETEELVQSIMDEIGAEMREAMAPSLPRAAPVVMLQGFRPSEEAVRKARSQQQQPEGTKGGFRAPV